MPRRKNFIEDVVIEKSMRIFWEKGYNAASINDLVDCVKINRASMYASFTDKHTLFVTCLKYYYEHYTVPFIQMIGEDLPVREVLVKIFTHIDTNNAKSSDPKGCFMVNATIELATSDAEIAEIVNNNRKDIETALSNLFRKAQERKEISQSETPENLAQFFYTVISGLYTIVKANSSREYIHQVAKTSMMVLN